MRIRLTRVLVALTMLFAATNVMAQDVPLSGVIFKLTTDITLFNTGHEAHFIGSEASQTAIPLALNRAIAAQLSNVPLASSSGGFTWTLNPSLGTVERRTSSFGPAFAERALTTGKGKWSLGANYQRATYDTFEGKSLDGGIQVVLPHADGPPPNVPGAAPDPFFEGDVILNTLTAKLTNNTFVLFVNRGVTDRLDLGVAVPIVSVNMDVTVLSHIVRQASQDFVAVLHEFDAAGRLDNTTHQSRTASGIGDVILRGKYGLYQTPKLGVAAAVDLRLPTGDADNLLGTGATQAKIFAIVSGGQQRVSPHVNVGYTVTSGGGSQFLEEPPSEFNTAFGVDFAVSPQLTVAGDVLTRSLRGVGRLESGTQNFPFKTFGGVAGVGRFEQLSVRDGDLNLSLGAAGIKWNPRRSLLVSAHVLFGLTNAGLRDKFTPVVGIDYGF